METITDGRHGRVVVAGDLMPALRDAVAPEANQKMRSHLSELREVLSFDRHVASIVRLYKEKLSSRD